MGTALRLANGKPRMAEVPGTGTSSIYSETLTIGVGGLAGGTTITLPNSGTYTDKDLQVFLNGQLLEVGLDFNYVGTAPRTQIQTIIDLLEDERLRFRIEG